MKAAVGKKLEHNLALTALRGPGDLLLRTVGVPGPVAIVSGAADDADIALAAGICARYSDGDAGRVLILVESDAGARELLAAPIAQAELVANSAGGLATPSAARSAVRRGSRVDP